MGTSQPFAGRLRASVGLQHRTDAVGRPGNDRISLSEQRLETSLAYAPLDWLMLSLMVPVVRRQLEYVNGGIETLLGLGDAELRGRITLWRDRQLAPRHLLWLDLGAELPTAPIDRDAMGEPTDPELQAGSGSFDPLVGLAYAWFADPWSFYTSQAVYIPTEGRADFRAGTSFRSTNLVQYQLLDWFALRAGMALRWEGRTRLEQGTEPDTGGLIAFASPELVFSPLMDLIFRVYAQIPVLNRLYGRHDEGPIVGVGVAYDL